VALWARFCRLPHELLVTNSYMYSGFTYETGETWLPPLKRAKVDDEGHLRLEYWRGNEAIKGRRIPLELANCTPAFPDGGEPTLTLASPDGLRIHAGPERSSILRLDLPSTVVVLNDPVDFIAGVVLEGTITVTCRNPRLVSPAIGFYLEESPNEGTAILLEGHGTTRIGKLTLADRLIFACEDLIGPLCASPAGILPHKAHGFRLMARRNMFELYLDDRLVQTFNTTHAPGQAGRVPQRIGFIVQNGEGIFGDLKAWAMA
jgi:hypothetical protein